MNKIQRKGGRRKQNKSSTKSKIVKILIIVLILVIIIIGVLLGISANNFKTLAQSMIINENSKVVDKQGNVIAELGCERKNKKVKLS